MGKSLQGKLDRNKLREGLPMTDLRNAKTYLMRLHLHRKRLLHYLRCSDEVLNFAIFEFPTTVLLKTRFFWDVILCHLVNIFPGFE